MEPLRSDEIALLSPVMRRAFDRNALVPPSTVQRVREIRTIDIPIILMEFSLRVLNELVQVAPDNEGIQFARDQAAKAVESYREEDYKLLLAPKIRDFDNEEEGDGYIHAVGFQPIASGTEEPAPEAHADEEAEAAHQPMAPARERPSGGSEAALPTMVVTDPAGAPVESQRSSLRSRIAERLGSNPPTEGGTSVGGGDR